MSSLTQMLRLSDMRLSGDPAVLYPRSHLLPHLWHLNKLGWRVWDYYWSQLPSYCFTCTCSAWALPFQHCNQTSCHLKSKVMG